MITNDLKKELKQYWNYDNFRHPQQEIIETILLGKDALVIMPTGWGKSICFQLPALIQTGLTIIISPLIALMENQVLELQKKQLPAALLHNEINKEERQKTFELIENKQLKLLYLSPETLLSKPVWDKLINPDLIINNLILDEAHCLAQWGDSFRPAYRRLGIARETLIKVKNNQKNIPICAFTATADRETQIIIKETLKLKNINLFTLNLYRQNLHINVTTNWTPKGKKDNLINFIKKHKKESGLVYVRSRNDSELLTKLLQELGYKTNSYHAGLNNFQRRQIETDWLTENIQFVVCTSAFGMGINKDNIRWICHYQPPQLLSEYIQEIGRGGRDGKTTEILTLISETTGFFNPEDKQLKQFFLQQLTKKYRKTLDIVSKIPLENNIFNLPKKDINYELYLGILHSAKSLIWRSPFDYQIINKISSKSIDLLIDKQKQLSDKTNKFLHTKKCRWDFLLTSFDVKINSNFRCNNCDNCLKQ